MANRLCPVCGASFVDWAATCVDCGVALVDPGDDQDPRSLEEDEQLVYELDSWTIDQRTEVAQVMAESGIPHAWDGNELYVHVRFESAVDRLLEPIEYPGGAPEADPDAALPVPQEPLTEYDLSEWSPGARQVVASQFASAGIAFAWDGTLFLVSVDDEEAADDLLDELEESGALEAADEADDPTETPGAVLEMLFLAADRLRKDPLDADGLRDLATALALSNPAGPPYGVEPLMWQRVMSLADELAMAETGIDDEADDATETDGEPDPELAQDVAAELRELLRPFV